MTIFLYTFSFNPLMTSPSPSQLHVFIEKSREIDSWYVPFFGTYLLKSSLALSNLVPSFQKLLGEEPFVLTGTAPNLTAGALPQAVWDWVNGTPPLMDKAS